MHWNLTTCTCKNMEAEKVALLSWVACWEVATVGYFGPCIAVLLFVACWKLNNFVVFNHVPGPSIWWWWSYAFGWDILHCSGVWAATYRWLGFGNWSPYNDADRFPEHQGLVTSIICVFTYKWPTIFTCLAPVDMQNLSFDAISGSPPIPSHEASRLGCAKLKPIYRYVTPHFQVFLLA